MKLIGTYLSPYARRVAAALISRGLPFEHEAVNGYQEFETASRYNPVAKVPSLVLDDGEVLIDSHSILDYLDSLVPADRKLYPFTEPARHRALKIAALATGLADKSVSLFYEMRLHGQVSDVWVNRCRAQIAGVLVALEADRARRGGAYWFGDRIGHADIAVTAALSFLSEVHPSLIGLVDFPALGAHVGRLEALPAFEAIRQPFIAPT